MNVSTNGNSGKIDWKALVWSVILATAIMFPLFKWDERMNNECANDILDSEDVYLTLYLGKADDYVLESFRKDDPARRMPGGRLAWFASTRRELVDKCIAQKIDGKRLLSREEMVCLGAARHLCTLRKGPPATN